MSAEGNEMQATDIIHLLALLGITLPLWVGCGSASEQQHTTAPVPPKAATLLIDGQQAFKRGHYLDALVLADSAAQHAPNLAHVYFLRARVFTELQRYREAQAAYERVTALDPSFEGAWFNMANNAYRQGHFRKAVALYHKARETPSGLQVQILRQMGRAYAELGKPDSARWAYRQAIAADSTNAAVYADLGQVYEDEGELEQALAYSSRALAIEPANPAYRYATGSQLRQTGRFEEAVRELRTVIEARPWHAGAHYNLGQALLRLGREAEAQRYLVRADSLERLDAEIWRLRSDVEVNPGHPMPSVALGDALRRAGRLDEAMDAYKVALSLAPQNLALRNNVANLAHDLGNTDEAIRRYQAILRQDPTLASVWLNLGVAYADGGNKAAARQAWENVLKYAPDDPAATSYLASLDAH